LSPIESLRLASVFLRYSSSSPIRKARPTTECCYSAEDAEAPEEHLVVEIIAPPPELTFERLTVSPTARTMPPQTKKPPTNKGGRLTCLMLMVGTNPRLRQCHWRSIAAQRLSRCYRTSKSGFSITNTDEDCNEHFQDHRSRHWPHSFRSDRLIQRSGSRHAC